MQRLKRGWNTNPKRPSPQSTSLQSTSPQSATPLIWRLAGVVPDDETCAKAGIKLVRTGFQHTDLSDRGPDRVKSSIQASVHQFLDEDEGTPTIPLLAAAIPSPPSLAAADKK